MSRLELDDDNYDKTFVHEVADQCAKGLDLVAARIMAQTIMDHCYIRRSRALQCEYEADYAEYIDDMSLGGETYRPGGERR